uniref:Uncharacterized protein n=1 Tax=Romanomermis culicivorax TaxID=13658 RepID=A0A915L412_ROMCU
MNFLQILTKDKKYADTWYNCLESNDAETLLEQNFTKVGVNSGSKRQTQCYMLKLRFPATAGGKIEHPEDN